MYGPPIDLSFKDLNNVTDALEEIPRLPLRPLRIDSNNKYLSQSMRLNNNNITNLVGLEFMLSHFLAQPSLLGWLDLSCNKITSIECVLCELKELRVLYLHGNDIWSLSEVNKLGELNYLHTITLHGNLIENIKGYRSHVISILPHLKRMDFSAVTRQEKVLASIWSTNIKPPRTRPKDASEHD
ncbi:PREDICTED: leucine-rich repeat-containing protein 51-like [Poecilia mexicana]|uniref:Leucine-rich repeat-containing protein 51 n=2 Tax=Poecilia TaxID=8080 RepID=A0A3B3VMT2_9TELE|nr:PREDICTED: leucine-rich repeat-containing protein 51-like [Poecilia mexicana]XP_016520801.1 PREDICTED: leucine-rich repeat-containing protein 51-like isoform X2 [Poecilia formosa]